MAHRGERKMHVTCRSIVFAICAGPSGGSGHKALPVLVLLSCVLQLYVVMMRSIMNYAERGIKGG